MLNEQGEPILNEEGEVELDATATGTEDFLDLQVVGCVPGDRFTVHISLNQTQFTQDFVI